MEKIAAEGLLLHRACLKCHHCHTSLRLGGYAFDRDDPCGRFYCTQHYRLPAKVQRPQPRRSAGARFQQQRPAPTTTAAAAATTRNEPPSGNAGPLMATQGSGSKASAAAAKERHPETPERIAARLRREGIARLDLLNRGY